MRLSEILPDQRRIFTQMKVANQKNLVEQMADFASSFVLLSASTIAEALFAREKTGSTALGMGVAIPHARFPRIEKTIGCFFQLEKPIEFSSPDNLPVDLIFLLLVPEFAGSDHLQILAQLSRLFKTQGLLDKLRDTRDREEILMLLTNESIRKVA